MSLAIGPLSPPSSPIQIAHVSNEPLDKFILSMNAERISDIAQKMTLSLFNAMGLTDNTEIQVGECVEDYGPTTPVMQRAKEALTPHAMKYISAAIADDCCFGAYSKLASGAFLISGKELRSALEAAAHFDVPALPADYELGLTIDQKLNLHLHWREGDVTISVPIDQ